MDGEIGGLGVRGLFRVKGIITIVNRKYS